MGRISGSFPECRETKRHLLPGLSVFEFVLFNAKTSQTRSFASDFIWISGIYCGGRATKLQLTKRVPLGRRYVWKNCGFKHFGAWLKILYRKLCAEKQAMPLWSHTKADGWRDGIKMISSLPPPCDRWNRNNREWFVLLMIASIHSSYWRFDRPFVAFTAKRAPWPCRPWSDTPLRSIDQNRTALGSHRGEHVDPVRARSVNRWIIY